MAIDAVKYPQLARMESVQSESQSLGAFIEWLGEHGLSICTSDAGLRGAQFYPVLETAEQLLARYFDIDLIAVENERRSVLAEFRALQSAA